MFGLFKEPTHEWKVYTEDGELKMKLPERVMSQWVYNGLVNMTGNETAEFVDNLKWNVENIKVFLWKSDKIRKVKIK